MPKELIFILQSCRFSTEFISDHQNLIPSGFIPKVLLCEIPNRDPEAMELKTIPGLALHMHSAGNQFSLVNIASVSSFAKEKITLIVYYLSCLPGQNMFKKFCASPSKSSCQLIGHTWIIMLIVIIPFFTVGSTLQQLENYLVFLPF